MSTEQNNAGASQHGSEVEQLRARVEYLEARLAKAGEEGAALTAYAEQLHSALKHLRHNAFHSGADMGLALDVADEALADTACSCLRELSPGIAAITAERRRQIDLEGWTPEHDDEHDAGDLAAAASAYALNAADQLNPYSFGDGNNEIPVMWPWDPEWWKPGTSKRDLEKAGALIAAEWERLDRAERRQAEEPRS